MMISIVIAIKDNLFWTQKTIESVIANTTVSYELVLVDNASAQDTQDYLKTLKAVVVRNETNRGCAGAWNQGICAASGEYVCILNNDVEVPRGWLRALEDCYRNNNLCWLSPAMREGDLDYDLEEFNHRMRNTFKGRLFYDEFRGTAIFAKRKIFDKERMGLFDEAYEKGKYEDEDFYMRIKKAGKQCAVMTDVTIHHYGSKTVNAEKKQAKQDFEKKNRRTFIKKWWPCYPWRIYRKWRVSMCHRWVKWRYGLDY